MKTDIAITLFFLPEFEMQECEITKAGIERFASEMARSLKETADLVPILQKDGWKLKVVKSYLEGTHPDVNSAEEALERVTRLGIQDAIYDIGEWDGQTRLNGC